MKNYTTFTALLFGLLGALPALSGAAQPGTAPVMPDVSGYYGAAARAKTGAALDVAGETAKSGMVGRMPNLPVPTVGIDVDQIASRYRDLGKGDKPQSDESLLIFVSTSMPMATLVKLGNQAKRAGAVLVLRGVPGGLSAPGAWTRAMAQLKPVASTGARMQINPGLFRLYTVNVVPTFVLTRLNTSQCASDSDGCQAQLRAVGDVSLDYVLEKWTDGKGELTDQARLRFKRMKGAS
jgi:conjugal transfer pilus assembly protein TrbC